MLCPGLTRHQGLFWGGGCKGGGGVQPPPEFLRGLQAPEKMFDWPNSRKKIWPNDLKRGGLAQGLGKGGGGPEGGYGWVDGWMDGLSVAGGGSLGPTREAELWLLSVPTSSACSVFPSKGNDSHRDPSQRPTNWAT